MSDKRGSPRTAFNAKVKVMHTSIGESVFMTRDISDGGIFVLVDGQEFPPIGSSVQVQVQGMPIAAPIVEMVIVRKGSDGYGLQFLVSNEDSE